MGVEPATLADFYAVPRARIDELRDLARIGATGRPYAMLESLGSPAPRYESQSYTLASVLGYLDEKGIVDTEPEGEYGDLMMDLVENHGGSWSLLEPHPETIRALDPKGHAEADLRAFYEEVSEEESPDAGSAMLEDLRLLHQALAETGADAVLLIRFH